jgi:uncharacterized protein
MRHLFWESQSFIGFESLEFSEEPDGFVADSVVLGIEAGTAYRVHYRIYLDLNWRAESMRISHLPYGTEHRFYSSNDDSWWRGDFHGDDEGVWQNCIDLDLSCTPFTNTLPIRRLNLEVGQSSDINVLYVECSNLTVKTAPQRYERLNESEYRFTNLNTDFTAVITVDAEGFVTNYPGLFERRSV